jgi:hypothetical protein
MSGKNGGRGRDRTYDQSIKSRMLYQLSYASFCFAPGEGGCGERYRAVKLARLQLRNYLKITQLAAKNRGCKL